MIFWDGEKVENKSFSLITIVNKEEVYREFKKKLSKQKNVNYELIKIENDNNQYSSAREAYNKAAKIASGDYLVFLHPDIRFLDTNALHDILINVNRLSDYGLIGIAGSPNNEDEDNRDYIVTTLVQNTKKENIGEAIKQPTKVQTVDECFFVVKRSFWEKHPFSDIVGWHFYAVEQSLIALNDGLTNYVVPARVWHISPGASENIQYIKIGKEIVKRYGRNFTYINTTVEQWYTHGLKKELMPWVNFIAHKVQMKVKKHPNIYSLGRKIKRMVDYKNQNMSEKND
ncbi:family 2 glycosyl transferase [Limosilactobacillus sp. WF-MO7-1]|uniref:Family 2 glycosyl transferase n=2 Tax=Limosilactobacillus fastidiosus TaxID=2759855 RepID=A0ABR6E8L9_9LACO|nr:glycosyltransferase [Limosilactobacillus fastidiosus]MBB1063535.1 family 2 glycosyl transferase [Limosilactobacillus fastidiosus]